MADNKSTSIMSLILVPALITLGVTILRLVGELQHWPRPWFDNAAGGGAALVGISWLPIIFGPYFALKLANAAEGPLSMGKAIGFTVLGLIVFLLGGFVLASTFSHPSPLSLVGFLIMLVAAFIPRIGWRSLGNVLFAYAFAARIPVLIVMFFAMRGNGGTGWGTHYDASVPMFAHAPFATKFLNEAILPQMTLWIGYTVVLGSLIGVMATAIRFRRRSPAPAEGGAQG
ncbi:MAG TPA: hypothetical protein VKV79_00800 [Terriglobia bacterium]|nr:hypothetical protein [Terriglobia bacterium]